MRTAAFAFAMTVALFAAGSFAAAANYGTAAEAAKHGQFTEISYMFPRPGADTTPVQKVSFVTKVGDLGCGVGYHK